MDYEINGPLDAIDDEIPNAQKYFALFSVPRIEGSGIYWKPILVGHEVAHVYESENSIGGRFDLRSRFDFERARNMKSFPQIGAPDLVSLRLYEVANNWLKETICDYYSLLRYGPAAIPAIGEYFSSTGDLYALNSSHPPSILRLHLLLKQSGSLYEASDFGKSSPLGAISRYRHLSTQTIGLVSWSSFLWNTQRQFTQSYRHFQHQNILPKIIPSMSTLLLTSWLMV